MNKAKRPISTLTANGLLKGLQIILDQEGGDPSGWYVFPEDGKIIMVSPDDVMHTIHAAQIFHAMNES